MFQTLFKFREVGYVFTILVLVYFVFHGTGNSGVATTGDEEPEPVVVVDTSEQLATRTVERSKEAEKPTGLGERLGTRMVQPDTVYVSAPVVPRVDQGATGVETSGTVPDWGIQEVDIDGHTLSVNSLSRRTGEVQRSVHTLKGDYQPGVNIRAGNVPRSVREDRAFDLINFRARGTAYVGVNAATGEPRVIGILSGPIEIGTERLRLSPAVMGGVDQGVSIGATVDLCLLGAC